MLQRPVLPARPCRTAAAASAAGSTGTANADSAAPHADKPNEQRTITQLVNSILPQPEQLIAVALAAALGLLVTRVFDGKGVHNRTCKESHLAQLPKPPPTFLLILIELCSQGAVEGSELVQARAGIVLEKNCPALRAGLLLGLGLLSSYFARFAAPVLVVLAAARGSSRAPSLTPLFAFASAVFACRWHLFNQCASRPLVDESVGSENESRWSCEQVHTSQPVCASVTCPSHCAVICASFSVACMTGSAGQRANLSMCQGLAMSTYLH